MIQLIEFDYLVENGKSLILNRSSEAKIQTCLNLELRRRFGFEKLFDSKFLIYQLQVTSTKRKFWESRQNELGVASDSGP